MKQFESVKEQTKIHMINSNWQSFFRGVAGILKQKKKFFHEFYKWFKNEFTGIYDSK